MAWCLVWARGDRVGRKGVRVCVCVGKQRRRGQLASKLHIVARRVGWKKKSPHTTPPKTCPTRAKRGLPGPCTLGDPEPVKCGCGVGILPSPSLRVLSHALPTPVLPCLWAPRSSLRPLEIVALFQEPCSSATVVPRPHSVALAASPIPPTRQWSMPNACPTYNTTHTALSSHLHPFVCVLVSSHSCIIWLGAVGDGCCLHPPRVCVPVRDFFINIIYV